MNLELLSNKMKLKYYENLVKYCKPNDPNYKYFLKKSVELKDSFTESNSVSESDNIKATEVKNNNSSESKEIVYSDDYLYKKPWIKLSSVHKIIKLKEFISKLLINDSNEKENLTSKIVSLVNSKLLTKKDSVKYDINRGQVIAIPILSFKNGKYVL
tara:strand:- start:360 stop:830 length:471 start_codon:yes stop_codon:yes gene_type:complete